MKIKDFDIWYIYSTFYLNDNLDLHRIANNFIYFDCADIVLDNYGGIYWKNDREEICHGKSDAAGSYRDYKISYPEDFSHARDSQKEFAKQYSHMIVSSQEVFREYFTDSFDHIRIFCAPYYLYSKDFNLSLCPLSYV